MQLYAKQNQYKALYLDISCLIMNLQDKSIYGKNMKNVSLCSVFLRTRHRAKLRREVTPSKEIVKT